MTSITQQSVLGTTIVPALDVFHETWIRVERIGKYVDIVSFCYGDGFPNSEGFIADSSGKKLFLGSHVRIGYPWHALYCISKSPQQILNLQNSVRKATLSNWDSPPIRILMFYIKTISVGVLFQKSWSAQSVATTTFELATFSQTYFEGTLIAEFENVPQSWIDKQSGSVGKVWVAPESPGAWLSPKSKAMFERAEPYTLDLSADRDCQPYVAHVKKSGRPVEGFTCHDSGKVLLYLTLSSPGT